MAIASFVHLTWSDDVLQITRSIGDVYLKRPEFNREPLHSKFRLPETFRRPLLSSEPAITVHPIQLTDQFIIFASDGLWEHLSNQKAVELVHSSPRNVCALILYLAFFTWFFLKHSASCYCLTDQKLPLQ
jgi:serine/threonine protein phosphatase PrpC